MQRDKKLLLSILFLFIISFGYAQTVKDTIPVNDVIDENLDEEDADTTASDTINHALPVYDPSSVPAASIYKSWNNLFVNPYGIDLVKKPDTTVIDLSQFVSPIKGRINSGFGWRGWQWHYGLDLKLQIGDSVRSVFDGMIRISKHSRSFGNYIVVRHTNGLETVYGHLSKLLVVCNQTVKAGEVIALGGNTGRSTGPHLHFEVRFLGNCINPNDIINFDDYTLRSNNLLLCQNNFNYLREIRKIRFHRVRKGDTLGKIARRYHVSVSRLCKLNHIRRTTLLRLGRNIRYT
jgi:murein DD-endopeptidase MepM/ murein hydrolase activator NlpD